MAEDVPEETPPAGFTAGGASIEIPVPFLTIENNVGVEEPEEAAADDGA